MTAIVWGTASLWGRVVTYKGELEPSASEWSR